MTQEKALAIYQDFLADKSLSVIDVAERYQVSKRNASAVLSREPPSPARG